MKISINLQKGEIQKENSAPLIVGIDLGTTNSLVAHMVEAKPLAIKDVQGSTLVPSVLHFKEDGQILVGAEAKAQLAQAPERTVFSVKRLLGKSYQDLRDYQGFFAYRVIEGNTEDALVKVQVGSRFYSPVELSALILAELKARMEAHLGRPVSQAVITVPAYFNDVQRQATRDAGKLAGLDVLRIVNEPTAASLAYGLGLSPEEHKTVAVYDLGGGTFDISILRIEGGIFEVLSTHGDTLLGGDDFDRLLATHWAERLGQVATPELRLLAEQAKKTLSSQTQFEAEYQGQTLRLSRAEFEALIQPLIERTLQSCRQALADAGLAPSAIDEVLLVGGSTRVPAVKAAVQACFGKIPNDSLNPDEVVALGAAVQADILAGNQKGMLLLDVTPLSLGIETLGGLMDVIIPRNSKIPIRAGRQYTTSKDGQINLKVSVFQGERDLVKDNHKLGEFTLKGIPPMPAGLPKIEIHFLLDADGILRVRAKELRSGVEQTVTVRSPYSLSQEDMGRMLLDSVQNAQSDMQIRSLIEARTEAESVLLATDKFILQHQNLFSPEAIEGLKIKAEHLLLMVQGTDKDLIRQAMEALNDYAAPLAHQALDKTIAEAMQGQKIG